MDSFPRCDIVRFGTFELDLGAHQLRRQGRRIPLQEKPFQLLQLLVERRGQVVTRDEIRRRLWPEETFVAWDDNLNTAVRKVREALRDSADGSRYVETVPRVGYRFLAHVETNAPSPEAPVNAVSPAVLLSGRSDGTQTWRRGRKAIGLAILILLAISLWFLLPLRRPASEDVVTFEIAPPDGVMFSSSGAEPHAQLSPDGRMLLFLAGSPLEPHRIWLRALDSPDARALPGTEGGQVPFWSPDNDAIAFFSNGKLRSLDLSSGTLVTLANGFAGGGGTWNSDGTILFCPTDESGLHRISGRGGLPERVTVPDRALRERRHVWPQFLPGGRSFIYLALADPPQASAIYLASLDSEKRTRLLDHSLLARFLPPSYLLYVKDGVLLAHPFNLKRGRLEGHPVPIAKGVPSLPVNGSSSFSVASNRTLVYSGERQEALRELVWFDRSGRRLQTVEGASPVVDLELSPDGRWLTLQRPALRPPNPPAPDIWIYDLFRGVSSRITDNPANDEGGAWAPDSRRFVYARHRGFHQIADLYLARRDDGQEPIALFKGDVSAHPTDWSADGRFVFYESSQPAGDRDLWLLPISVSDPRVIPWLRTQFDEAHARLSPTGQWVAFESNESGETEIYLRPFADPNAGVQRVSTGGGSRPRWRGDGRELFYVSRGAQMMGAAIGPTGIAGEAKALFDLRRLVESPSGWSPYAVSRDGQRFLVAALVREAANAPVTVVLNAPPEVDASLSADVR